MGNRESISRLRFDGGHSNSELFTRDSILREFAGNEEKQEDFIKIFKDEDTPELWQSYIEHLEDMVENGYYLDIIIIKDHWRKY